jgi:hypothetical protein
MTGGRRGGGGRAPALAERRSRTPYSTRWSAAGRRSRCRHGGRETRGPARTRADTGRSPRRTRDARRRGPARTRAYTGRSPRRTRDARRRVPARTRAETGRSPRTREDTAQDRRSEARPRPGRARRTPRTATTFGRRTTGRRSDARRTPRTRDARRHLPPTDSREWTTDGERTAAMLGSRKTAWSELESWGGASEGDRASGIGRHRRICVDRADIGWGGCEASSG